MADEPSVLPTAQRKALLDEFISGGVQAAAYAAIRQALPQYIDDVTRDFGGDVYERMLHDPIVSSRFNNRKNGILADGLWVTPAIDIPTGRTKKAKFEQNEPDRYADALKAKDYADFIQRCFDGMVTPLVDVAGEILSGLAYGNKIAEIILRRGTGLDAGRLVLRAIKGKHRNKVAFVVDNCMNVQGFLGVPADGNLTDLGFLALGGIDPTALESFVPDYKCLVFQHDVRDGDPRGNSILRPAYLPWFMKTQVLPEFFKFLKQFASPGIIGMTPEETGSGFVPKANPDGTPIVDADGIPVVVTAEAAMMEALLGWLNGVVLVVKGGSKVDFLQSEGDGEAFLSALDYFDRQITEAIEGTDGMSMAAKNDSGAAKGVGQDVVGLRVALDKQRLGNAFDPLIRLLIRLNYGDDAVRLAPRVVLTRVEKQDKAALLKAYSDAYGKGFIHDSQLPEIDDELDLPERDMEQIAAEKAEKGALSRMAMGEVGKVVNPAGEDPADA